jgi:hypothetical protein
MHFVYVVLSLVFEVKGKKDTLDKFGSQTYVY